MSDDSRPDSAPPPGDGDVWERIRGAAAQGGPYEIRNDRVDPYAVRPGAYDRWAGMPILEPPPRRQPRVSPAAIRRLFKPHAAIIGEVPPFAFDSAVSAVAQVHQCPQGPGRAMNADLARAAVLAATPSIQLALLRRVTSENVWKNAWWSLFQVATATLGLLVALWYASVHRVVWLVLVSGCALAFYTVGVLMVTALNRREIAKTRELLRKQAEGLTRDR